MKNKLKQSLMILVTIVSTAVASRVAEKPAPVRLVFHKPTQQRNQEINAASPRCCNPAVSAMAEEILLTHQPEQVLFTRLQVSF